MPGSGQCVKQSKSKIRITVSEITEGSKSKGVASSVGVSWTMAAGRTHGQWKAPAVRLHLLRGWASAQACAPPQVLQEIQQPASLVFPRAGAA